MLGERHLNVPMDPIDREFICCLIAKPAKFQKQAMQMVLKRKGRLEDELYAQALRQIGLSPASTEAEVDYSTSLMLIKSDPRYNHAIDS